MIYRCGENYSIGDAPPFSGWNAVEKPAPGGIGMLLIQKNYPEEINKFIGKNVKHMVVGVPINYYVSCDEYCYESKNYWDAELRLGTELDKVLYKGRLQELTHCVTAKFQYDL